MSTAKLNIWVTEVGNPCKIDMKHQWFVHVLHCDGELLNWCDKVYTNLRTKCGHLEIDVPPGCDMVCATWCWPRSVRRRRRRSAITSRISRRCAELLRSCLRDVVRRRSNGAASGG